jgi:predicted nucleic acid-binding protein
MAASPVLADSSFYIGLLRQGQDPLKVLALAAAERDLAICGVVRCEVGRGLRSLPLRHKFRAVWDVMIQVPTDNRLWEQAEQMLWDLDRHGSLIPLTDAVIACCALRVGAVVLTYDRHFSVIPGLRVTDQLEP